MIETTQEALASRGKVLVHVGRDHTFRQGERLGKVLSDRLPDRVFQIVLHFEFPVREPPSSLTRLVEELAAVHDGQAIGFDVVGSPLADLRDLRSAYWKVDPSMTLGSLIEGYVFLAPLADLHEVTWIDDYVTEQRFEEARAVAEKVGWAEPGTCNDARALNEVLAKRFSGKPIR